MQKSLRAMDLADLMRGHPVMSKMAYRERIRRLCRPRRAQQVAGNNFRGLRKVCKEVVRKKGAATSG